MRAPDIQAQIESIRTEVRGINTLLQRIQTEDVRRVYGSQIRSVLVEKAQRFFETEGKMGGTGPHGWLDEFERRTMAMIEQTISAYQLLDRGGATKVMGEYVSGEWPDGPKESFQRCLRLVDEIVEQFDNYFSISDGWIEQISGPGHSQKVSLSEEDILSPEKVEVLIGPLSNAIRVGVLLELKTREGGLTELSRRMGLQKGHLQFHVKILSEAGYVLMDRRTHLYFLTSRGERALKGLGEMVKDLELKE
jgi:DNA-binding transcriptional ArsR family regulator